MSVKEDNFNAVGCRMVARRNFGKKLKKAKEKQDADAQGDNEE